MTTLYHDGQPVHYYTSYLGVKPFQAGATMIVGPATTVASLGGMPYDRRVEERFPLPNLAECANQVMQSLYGTMPEHREIRLERLGKVYAVTYDEGLASEVVRVVTLRGRTLGWWP